MVKITARPQNKFERRNNIIFGGLLNHDCLSFKEINSLEKKSKAFCQSPLCYSKGNRYKVQGLSGDAFLIDCPDNQINCPNCNKALFWGAHYSSSRNSFYCKSDG